MANGYGSSSSSSSSSSARRSATNTQSRVAPPGFHYMPDGTLMSDAQHAAQYGSSPTATPTSPNVPVASKVQRAKVIKKFDIDLSSLSASGGKRSFVVDGDTGSLFNLEVKNEDNHYYNFNTGLFQATRSLLQNKLITEGGYKNSISFPVVTDDDQYDIYLYSQLGTIHSGYGEVRFEDGTVDINNSIGSNSYLIQKVIYQYATDLQLKLDVDEIVTVAGDATAVKKWTSSAITLSTHGRGVVKSSRPFEVSFSSIFASSLQIIKQPTISDIFAYNRFTIGNPEALPGENVYPAISNTDTVDGAITGGGSVIKVVMDTNVADKMIVGDKITAAVATDTVDGAVESGIKVVMDNNVVGKMAIGDRITGNAFLTSNLVTVAALNPDGDNAKEFSMSEAVALTDGVTLTFTPKCNRSLTTVAVLNPDDDNAKEFSMSQNVGFVDGVTLSFSNQKNKRWALNTLTGISAGQSVLVSESYATLFPTLFVANSIISNYKDTLTVFEGTEQEETIIKNKASAIDTKSQKPTITDGFITTQLGNVIFSKQQPIGFNGGAYSIGGYGGYNIQSATGYSINATDLAIALTPITVTTTAAVHDSAIIPVTSVNGIVDNVTTVSGLGINSGLADPVILSKSVTSGAGDITLNGIQNLEKGVTLTLAGSGQTATITGNIEIIKSPLSIASNQNALRTLYFDVDKLVSIS